MTLKVLDSNPETQCWACGARGCKELRDTSGVVVRRIKCPRCQGTGSYTRSEDRQADA